MSINNKINYIFKDERLLKTALNHPSVVNGKKDSYQKLEILGDSVLSLIIIEMLIEKFPNLSEGEIHMRKANLVCGKTLSTLALKIGLGEYINMSRATATQGGRKNHKILEDVVESIIGAIYKDGGIENARNFVNRYWEDLIKQQKDFEKNPKSRLQEYLQKHSFSIPEYSSDELINDGVTTSYKVNVVIPNLPSMEIISRTKNEGEVELAEKMIEYIRKNIDKSI
ncbi:MAG: ribonuclease III [Rickettsiales bacterium]|jgi:ribonuclease-3|nr:ribonuclease III [Rickettsiales bacterium]